jgi:AcrR family transcriptional regulator
MTVDTTGELAGEILADCEFTQRERHLLRHARQLLREGGYDHVTINRLAKRSGLSRVTLYKHFANRQDIVLKLAIQSTGRRADMVQRGALFRGKSRERLVAISSVIRELMPFHMHHELLADEDGIRDKASPALLRELQANEDRIVSSAVGVIRDAVVAGDVTLPDDLPPEKLGLALIEFEIGAQVVMRRTTVYGRYTAEEAFEVLKDFGAGIVDRLGWRPLSSEHDYDASTQRMWMELFPGELKRFGIRL